MTTIQFDKKLECGPEFVAVRIIENGEDLKVGNIWLLQNAEANGRLARAVVEDAGSKAKSEYGIQPGDYVMIDRLSTFAHTAPVAALKYDSVICKTNEAGTEFFPLKNMLFVQPDQHENEAKVDNIFVLGGYDGKLNTGTILKMNCDEDLHLPFKVGDKVMLTKGADVVQFNQHKLHIYKHDMIVATIKD